jgi:hypothetical protein
VENVEVLSAGVTEVEAFPNGEESRGLAFKDREMSRLVLVQEALMDCVLVERVHEKS